MRILRAKVSALAAGVLLALVSVGINAAPAAEAEEPRQEARQPEQQPAPQTPARAATQPAPTGQGRVTIGVSVGSIREERWQRDVEMFKEYGKTHGINVVVDVSDEDPDRQIRQCKSLIADKVDVLVLVPADSGKMKPVIEEAHKRGIKVIAYDRLIMNTALDYYVTFDTLKVGTIQARTILDVAPKGRYIVMRGAPEDNNSFILAQGQNTELAPYIESNAVKVVFDQWVPIWSPQTAEGLAKMALLAANNNVQGIVASNDGTAGGIINALAAAGLAGKVPISGQDADLTACQRIVAGTQTSTVYKPLATLNRAAMDLATAIARGRDPKAALDPAHGVWTKMDNNTTMVESFSVDVVPITRENLVEIMIKQEAFHSLEDVFKYQPKEKWPKL